MLAVVSINLLQPGSALSCVVVAFFLFFCCFFFFHNDHLNSMSFLILVITMRKTLFIFYCQLFFTIIVTGLREKLIRR